MIKVNDVTKLINSIYQSDIDNLTITKVDTKITINRVKVQQNYNSIISTINSEQNYKKSTINQTKVKEDTKKIDKINENNTHKHSNVYSTIISPMVGTFYKSPAPNEPSFIEIGETVKPKQIVCIVEAMKLMNEIESEVIGEVVEILVKDGDIVDCGQALIKIKIK
uniref:Biotin carboxyl carrier protein of acetyl-CoA carboxylase n=1 Tax=Periphykon beckeri TaxID=2006982 RepID=A0A1Z1M3D4_9FLOR|nr:acetyl-CoA carboxylase biotin carboxyl carrier protein [Periphykon beckeri]ARW60432.1 acetyl-CoA carboxylase biotin carboxyl carrier protein [Periphykon beckeri]